MTNEEVRPECYMVFNVDTRLNASVVVPGVYADDLEGLFEKEQPNA